MKKLFIASLLLAASNLYAAGFSYNNVSISYANVDIDLAPGFSVDGDGFDIEGNIAVHPSIFIPVRYLTVDFDDGYDGTMYLVGVGGHMPLSNTMDAFGMIQLGNLEVDGPGPSGDDDMLALTAGIRTALANNLEGTLYATIANFDDYVDDQSGIGGKLHFYVKPNIAIVGRVEFLSDMDTLSVGAQFDF